MSKTRHAGSPAAGSARYVEWTITALGIVGLVVLIVFFDRAFPSAALDLELSRAEIAARAAAYVESVGYDVTGLKFALTFHEEWMSSVYLQNTLGIPRTNALAREARLPLWLWEARWYKPLQKEGIYLSLMPDGTVVALTHTVLEDAPGVALAQEDALALAQTYLTQDRGWALRDWELISSSTEVRTGGRQDHYFAWRRQDWDVGSSELRLAVDIQGDRVGGYGYWLHVPESFIRRFSEQRNRAGFVEGLSYYLGVGGFGILAFFYYVLGHRRGVLPWRAGLALGLAVAGVEVLDALNALLLRKAGYGTTQDYVVFWVQQVVDIVLYAGSVAGAAVVLWEGGRYLARKVWRQEDKVLARGEGFWVSLCRSAWRGLMLGAVDAGYVVVFYLVATQVLGAWMPMDSPAVNLYATPVPFVAPIAAGVTPALTEELLFRLVGIGAVWAITKRRWLAALVPGLLWAFAHLGYVRDPIYLRGIELTLVALLYGWAFMRFDLATTIVAHLAFNAGLTAIPLLRSGHLYFVANGGLVILGLLAPVLPGAAQLLSRRLKGHRVSPEPLIRPAAPADARALATLCEHDPGWRSWIEHPRYAVLCLACGDRVIGAAAGRVDAEGTGWVERVVVARDWRRRYWASQLVETLGAELREKGAGAVRAVVPAGDWILARFWDAQDWLPAATIYAERGEPSAGRRRRGLWALPFSKRRREP